MIDQHLHSRLRAINTELTTIEKLLIRTAIRLDTSLREELSERVDGIVDYELEVTIACYGTDESDTQLCTLNEYLKGVSISDNKRSWRLGDKNNHNEFEYRENHPLQADQHCWLFHCLYDHERLSWEEIASIQNFWIDIIPRYQYCIDIPNTDFTSANKHLIFSDKYQFGMIDVVRNIFPDFFDSYPLDLRKFEKIGHHLQENIAYVHLKPMSDEDLEIFHTVEYLQSLREDKSVIEGVVAFPIPSFITASMMNEHLIDAARSMVEGTVYAAKLALKSGWAINIGGGFHHARFDGGGGFCFFNDYAIATYHLRQTTPNLKILYVDLDAHLGDGVISFAKDTENFYILDMYNAFTKLDDEYRIKTDVDKRFTLIGLQSYTADKTYLGLLRDHLPKIIDSIEPDIIYYNGGSDVLVGDPLGYLSISPAGLIERDLLVFGEAKKRKIPIMMCLSGGYGKENYLHVINSLEAVISLMQR